MELAIDHVLAYPLAAVERALLSPRALALLPTHVPMIAGVRLLFRRDGPTGLERAIHVRAARVPTALGALVPRSFSAWIERARWDLRTHAGTFAIEPLLPAPLRRAVRCEGTYTLIAQTPDRTARQIRGVIEVRVPVVGGWAERTIAAIIARQFEGEAALLAALAEDDRDDA